MKEEVLGVGANSALEFGSGANKPQSEGLGRRLNSAKAAEDSLARDYQRQVESYLRGGGLKSLHRSKAIAMQALEKGVDILELAVVHHDAILNVLIRGLHNARSPRDVETVGGYCTSCPAWLRLGGLTDREVRRFEEVDTSFRNALLNLMKRNQKLIRDNQVLRRVTQTREEESRRIADAIHDEAAQLLAAVHLSIDEATAELPEAVGNRFKKVKRLVEQVEHELRRLSHELRPANLEEGGLGEAVGFLAEGIAARAKIRIEVHCAIQDPLPAVVETAVYRVVREALNNVAKHARATAAKVDIRRAVRELACSVTDDGRGMTAADRGRQGPKGIGVKSMRERVEVLGGRLTIRSAVGRGTKLSFRIPLEALAGADA